MQLNLKKVADSNETQTEEASTKTSEEAQVINGIVIADRGMNHIEEALLKNQKALAQTLDDVQKRYVKQIADLLQNNAALSNRVMAMEMQVQGLHVRMAMMAGTGATVVE